MDTLLYTTEGIAPIHAIVEAQAEARSVLDDEKDLRWEALRQDVNTLGARAALDKAMEFQGGHILFEYLWFVIAVAAVVLALRAMSWADTGSRTLDPIPSHVRQRN